MQLSLSFWTQYLEERPRMHALKVMKWLREMVECPWNAAQFAVMAIRDRGVQEHGC